MSELVGAAWALSPQKRALDLLGMTALMPLFVPAGAVIASKIHSVDEMDPIFSHTRYGIRFEPFVFYKFRTMPPDVSPEVPSMGSYDSRRTNLGVKLSSKHLDEMPQAINIYNGTMSMVGPRALVWPDIENTFDVLSALEQREWRYSRWFSKPAVFGRSQLGHHINNYESGSYEEFLLDKIKTPRLWRGGWFVLLNFLVGYKPKTLPHWQ